MEESGISSIDIVLARESICFQLVSYLSQKDLLNLSLVDQRFYYIARCAFYQIVELGFDVNQDGLQGRTRIIPANMSDVVCLDFTLGLIKTNAIPEEMRQKFIRLLKPVEDECTEYRQANLMGRGNGLIKDIIDPSFNIRGRHWVAVEIQINEGRSRIQTEIPNVPRKYGKIYQCIEEIFDGILPLFHHLLRYKLGSTYPFTNGTLHSVMKSQSYQLKPGQEYRGNLHQDGLPEENIIAVAIWYYDVSPHIEGGGLAVSTSKSFAEENCDIFNLDHPHEGSFRVTNNQVIVFNNQDWCHEVLQTKNTTNKLVERKIFTFFLCHPGHSPVTSRTVEVNKSINDLELVRKLRDDFLKVRVTIPKPKKDRKIDFHRYRHSCNSD
mmetsp:Transcript_42431/g.48755  ORF Transcript_42431/g.48755 Transcript_42431/m.48755 type:complete len:381 (+) Transcript_42431:29-1171(+)